MRLVVKNWGGGSDAEREKKELWKSEAETG